METWKTIPSAPNYEASTDGRIRRAAPGKRTRVGKILRQRLLLGYWVVVLTHDAQQIRHRVNRLVCETFNGPAPPGKPLAAHTDGDPNNNRPENLRWVDHRENAQDMLGHGKGLTGAKAPAAKLTAYDVVAIRAAAEAGRDYRVLAQQFNIHPSNAWYIIKRKTWKNV